FHLRPRAGEHLGFSVIAGPYRTNGPSVAAWMGWRRFQLTPDLIFRDFDLELTVPLPLEGQVTVPGVDLGGHAVRGFPEVPDLGIIQLPLAADGTFSMPSLEGAFEGARVGAYVAISSCQSVRERIVYAQTATTATFDEDWPECTVVGAGD